MVLGFIVSGAVAITSLGSLTEAFSSHSKTMTGVPIQSSPSLIQSAHGQSNRLTTTAFSSTSSSDATTCEEGQETSSYSKESIKGIIFDIDGTLADSWNLGYQATKTVLTDYHNSKNSNGEGDGETLTPDEYPLTSEEYHFGCRYTTPERLARHVGLEPGHPSFESVGEELGSQFDDYYVQLVDKSTAGFYDGISDLLIKLHCGDLVSAGSSESFGSDSSMEGLQLGALTNACVEYAHAVLKANCPKFSSDIPSSLSDNDDASIYPRFTSIHGANSVPRPKPFGDGILKCCEEMGLSPSQVIYVGDAPTDARAAVAAECRAAIGVLWGSNGEDCLREEKGFEALCRDVNELEKAIGKYL